MGGHSDPSPLPALSWWERWPALYDFEMEAFARHEVSVDVLCKKHGVLIVSAKWPVGDDTVELRIGFSPTHPFARPSVSAPALDLPRHQDPFRKVLCLITQDSGQWHANVSVADHIAEQLPRIFAAIKEREAGHWEAAALLEEPAPDPLEVYFNHLTEPFSILHFSSSVAIPQKSYGIAEIGVRFRPEFSQEIQEKGAGRRYRPTESVLSKMVPLCGPWLTKSHSYPVAPGAAFEKAAARWVRMERPPIAEPRELLAAAEARIRELAALSPADLRALEKVGEAGFSFTIIVFEDEMVYGPDGKGDGFLFLVSRRSKPTQPAQVSLVRGLRHSDEQEERVPVARILRKQTALVVGLGAIGSFVGLELARAKIGELRLLDSDLVLPGNSIRWPFGSPAWGYPKAGVLRGFIQNNYPDVKVAEIQGRIGEAVTDTSLVDSSPLAKVREIISGVDVVIDTSASTECQHALAFHARDLGKPFIVGYATEGAAGGVVARFLPDGEACFVCLAMHWADDAKREVPKWPSPPVDPTGTVVLTGCNSPTFTGGSFDLQEVSLEVVRSTVGTLAAESYDAGDWNLAVLSHRIGEKRTPPQWSTATIPPHPACCGRVSA